MLLKHGEFVEGLNQMTLATAAGQGDKAAFKQVRQITHKQQEREGKRTRPLRAATPVNEEIDISGFRQIT
jgi:hypothetical protein